VSGLLAGSGSLVGFLPHPVDGCPLAAHRRADGHGRKRNLPDLNNIDYEIENRVLMDYVLIRLYLYIFEDQ
jgi:hypothetical protein